MRPRDPSEARGQTALELLFDLAFSAASGFAAVQFAQALSGDGEYEGAIGGVGGGAVGGAGEALLGFAMVFFAIWWAWLAFSRFSSAYDTDDGLTWAVTALQIIGACVLAAGVSRAFAAGDFAVITVGYAVMRVPLAAQWCRAALGDPLRRATCLRFAASLLVLQVGWGVRLALPEPWSFPSFVLLAVGEVAAPLWAARRGEPPVNPGHLAGRHLRFALTVAAQTVAATVWSVRLGLDDAGERGPLLVVAVLSVGVVVSLVWLYCGMPHAWLAARRRSAGRWTYGHYLILGALCAVGSGVRFLVDGVQGGGGGGGGSDGGRSAVALAVAVGVAVLALWWVCALPVARAVGSAGLFLWRYPAAAVVAVGVAVAWGGRPLVSTGVVVAVLLALSWADRRAAAR
ncbi:low temperature requirement protein A [Streptomyces sp. O3]